MLVIVGPVGFLLNQNAFQLGILISPGTGDHNGRPAAVLAHRAQHVAAPGVVARGRR
jgi:hypothetical protein